MNCKTLEKYYYYYDIISLDSFAKYSTACWSLILLLSGGGGGGGGGGRKHPRTSKQK